jgi:transcriptional regulator of acetoin/glycerol metabolism
LLRVFQEREVRAIGDTTPLEVDIAVVSATNRDVEQLMEGERFRADLYARLAGHELSLPPLAERAEDIGWLSARLLASLDLDVALTRDAQRCLLCHDWPLNIRELQAALRHAAALAGDGVVDVRHLPPRVATSKPGAEAAPGGTGVRTARDARTRARLAELMRSHRGNLAAVAREMGKHRRQIHRWLQRFGVDPDDFRSE